MCQQKTKNPDDIAFLMLTAWGLNLDPVSTIPQLHIIQGNVALSAHLMTALVTRGGNVEVRIEEGDGWCEVTMARRDGTVGPLTFRWDLERVRQAGIKSPMWQKYPQQMLRKITYAEAARVVAAPEIMGAYVVDELEGTDNGGGIDWDAVGDGSRVLETPAEGPAPEPASPPATIGNEEAQKLLALVGAVAEASGKPERELVDYIRGVCNEAGASKVADLTEDQGQAVADWLAALMPTPEAEEPAAELSDEEHENAIHRAHVDGLFDEEVPTVPQWRAICTAEGITGETQRRIQLQVFGTVRPPQDPDEMGALIAATKLYLYGGVDLPDLPPENAEVDPFGDDAADGDAEGEHQTAMADLVPEKGAPGNV